MECEDTEQVIGKEFMKESGSRLRRNWERNRKEPRKEPNKETGKECEHSQFLS